MIHSFKGEAGISPQGSRTFRNVAKKVHFHCTRVRTYKYIHDCTVMCVTKWAKFRYNVILTISDSFEQNVSRKKLAVPIMSVCLIPSPNTV